MTVKGRMPRKPKRCAARTHHMSVTQPIMAMGMAIPGMMPAVRASFRMMTVNGTPTTKDHANMRSVSCSCQVGSSRQPSPVYAHTSPQLGAEASPVAAGRRGGCSDGLVALLSSATGGGALSKPSGITPRGVANTHTQSGVCLRSSA